MDVPRCHRARLCGVQHRHAGPLRSVPVELRNRVCALLQRVAILQDRAVGRGPAGPRAGEHNEHLVDGFTERSVSGRRQRLVANVDCVKGAGI